MDIATMDDLSNQIILQFDFGDMDEGGGGGGGGWGFQQLPVERMTNF